MQIVDTGVYPYKNIKYSLHVDYKQHAYKRVSLSTIWKLFDDKPPIVNCTYSAYMFIKAVINLYLNCIHTI